MLIQIILPAVIHTICDCPDTYCLRKDYIPLTLDYLHRVRIIDKLFPTDLLLIIRELLNYCVRLFYHVFQKSLSTSNQPSLNVLC